MIHIITILTLVWSSLGNSFSLSSFSVVPNYAKSSSSIYTFTLNTVSPFTANFDIHVYFQTQFSPTSVSNCMFWLNNNLVNNISCMANSSTNTIVFSNLNINTNISNFKIQFNTSTARYAGSSTLTFYYYDPTTNTAINELTSYVSLSIVNAVMNCSISSTSAIVGDNVTYTLSYTPLVPVQANSILQVQIQPWGAYSQSNFVTTNTSAICNGACILSLPSSNGNFSQLLRYTSLFVADTSATGSLALGKARNPASTKQITMSIVMLAKISTFSEYSYQNCTSSFSVGTPNTFKMTNFATTVTDISASNIITLRLQLTNPISSISYLRIQPNGLGLVFQYNFNNQGTQPFVVSSTTDGSLLLGNLTAATSAPGFLTLNNFTLTNPPYANKPVTMTFTTQNLVDSVFYLVDRGTADIVSTPSLITSASCLVTNTSINAISKYTISFKTTNRLITTSFVVIVLPASLAIYAGTTCSLTGFASTCAINSTLTLTVDINTIINAGSNLTVVINAVTNAATTTPTSSITITTYYEDTQSVVDQLTSGLTVTATSVPFRSVTLTPGSTTVGKITNYTLSIQIANALPATSILLITIPITSFAVSTITLLSFTIGSTAIPGCSISNTAPLTVQLSSACFPSSTPALTTLIVVLGNITNPLSTKPTDSWQIETRFNSLQMQYLFSGVLAIMDTPAAISYFKVSPTSQVVNAETTYLFEVTFSYPHYSGDRVILNLPTDITLGNGFQCVAITANVSLLCLQTSSTQWEVTFTLSNGSSLNALSFTITKITNNWYSSTRTIEMKTTTNSSIYYYVESGQNTVNFIPSVLSATALSNELIILLGQSNINLTITSPFSIPHSSDLTKLKLLVTVPSDLAPVTGTCALLYASATCVISNQTITITGFGDFSVPLTISFKAGTNYFVNTSPFTSQLYYGSDLIASDLSMKLASYCTVPCKQCTSNKVQCLSCLPMPYTTNNTYLSANNTCVTTCPISYYASAGQCLSCNASACYGCVDTANNCTSCQANTYLYGSTCLSICPDMYYAGNGVCNQCVPPCRTCSSPSACLSCTAGYFLDTDSRCVLTCSNTSYMGLNGTCQLCTNNCKTCSISLSNCTSCQSPQYLLLNHTCRTGCPTAYYNSLNTTCEPCRPPCSTCKSDTLCETCIPNYYLYNQTTCTAACPDGTLAVVNSCQQCDPSCATCSVVLSNCTSCATNYYFYLNDCVLTCPPPTNPYNKMCTLCIEPCTTCTSSPDMCLSCDSNLLLLNNSCVTQCPTNGYYQSGTSCLPCTNNCLSCLSLASCNLCQNNYYLLSGGCVQQCPDSSPIVENRECKSCSQECATCVGKSTNCTKCTVFYFKYEYTCVKECPLTYYSNVVTYQCEDGLSSKIVFFPVLITAIVVIFLMLLSKCFARETSFTTAVAALLSPLQLVIWIYVLALLFAPIKEPSILYAVPIALIIFALFSFFLLAVVFFVVNNRRMADDDYAVQWATNNTNYTVSVFVRFLSLAVGCRFFRIIYSRLFGSVHLSVAYKNRSNVFTPATIFTVCLFIFSEIPIIAGCWALVYSKTLKDQTFYSAIQALIVTAIAIIFSLVDIYKSQDFFDETEFYKQKRYVEKIRDLSSLNKLEEGFQISHEAGSVDAERFVGTSGGKFLYTKQKPEDLKDDDLYFEDNQDKSQATDAVDKHKKMVKKINIFGPIMEEDAQYYQNQKYDLNETNTQNQIEHIKRKQKTIESDEQQQKADQLQRNEEIGPEDGFDDNKSLLNEREIKKKWNNIIDKRKEMSNKIFNRHPPNLAQIDQPSMEQEDGNQQSTANIIRQLDYGESILNEQQGAESQINSKKKRRKRKLRNRQTNKELEQIYLQRLTDKKKSTKDMFSSDKSFKYDF